MIFSPRLSQNAPLLEIILLHNIHSSNLLLFVWLWWTCISGTLPPLIKRVELTDSSLRGWRQQGRCGSLRWSSGSVQCLSAAEAVLHAVMVHHKRCMGHISNHSLHLLHCSPVSVFFFPPPPPPPTSFFLCYCTLHLLWSCNSLVFPQCSWHHCCLCWGRELNSLFNKKERRKHMLMVGVKPITQLFLSSIWQRGCQSTVDCLGRQSSCRNCFKNSHPILCEWLSYFGNA